MFSPAPGKFHYQWLELLRTYFMRGEVVSPRGQNTRELRNVVLSIDARDCLLLGPRNLNYRFSVAEWLWISLGRSDVDSLARYNSVMRNFSDDGVKLAGSYGPRIYSQLDYIKANLTKDRTSRQAVLQIWKESPLPSKDIPCTLSAQFLWRGHQLHATWTMRSSDAWLGLPYDVFNFAMITNALAGELGARPGTVTLQLCSSHLYERHFDAARAILSADLDASSTARMPLLPGWPPAWFDGILTHGTPPAHALNTRIEWAPFAKALLARTSADALAALTA